MALFNYWGKENKITTSPLTTKYTMEYVRVRYGIEVYEYHKIRETQYSYVGMNYTTAKACQESEYERYRRVYTQEYNEYYNYIHRRELIPCAEVTMSNEGGHMWRVDVNVVEDQLQYDMKRDDPKFVPFWDDYGNIETLDDFGPYLRISWNEMNNQALILGYEYDNLGDFNIDNLKAEMSSDGNTWTEVQKIVRQDGKIQLNVGNWGKYNRLSYGDVKSNAVLKEDAHEYTNEFEITNVEYWVGGNKWKLYYRQDVPAFKYSQMRVFYIEPGNDKWVDITSECVLLNGQVITNLTNQEINYGFKLVFDSFEAVHDLPYSPEWDFGNGSVMIEGCVPNGVGSSEYIISGIDPYNSVQDYGSNLQFKGSNDGVNWDIITTRTFNRLGDRVEGGNYFNATFITTFKYIRVYVNDSHETTFRLQPIETDDYVKILGVQRFIYNSEMMLALWYTGSKPDSIYTQVRDGQNGEWVEQQIVGEATNKVYFNSPTNYNQDYGVVLKTVYGGMDSMRIEMPLSRESHI